LEALVGMGFCDWKHAFERLRNHEQSMEYIDAMVTFSRRCKSFERNGTELATQVSQCEQYWNSILPATLGFCHKSYCWACTGIWKRWRKRWITQNFFSKNCKTFFKQIFDKEDTMLPVAGFATISQIANHCQISRCFKVLLQLS